VACALGSAGAVMAGSLDMLVFCRALSGAAGAGIVPLSMAWIGDNVPYERRQATLARFLTGTTSAMKAQRQPTVSAKSPPASWPADMPRMVPV
ncbi:hypothetical protein LLE87_32085, partial [Paenibacillus polymyxa]|nr:hypothetical protein [Paenibacillus polymyxa]